MEEAKLDEVDEKLFEILDLKLKKVIVDCVHDTGVASSTMR